MTIRGWRRNIEVIVDRIENERPASTPAPAGASGPLPVCIAGMHRSGTSMVAQLLQQAGLYLGEPTDLMPPAEENPEGFFEHLEFVQLNDEVLHAAGAGWDCPPPAETDWSAPAFDPYRQRAALLAGPLAANPPWGWKDPRNSLTLPFWRSALGPMRAVVVVRNPLEVVTSLHRRNGFSPALSLTLWRIYAERVLQDTTPGERIITHFDAYFFEPEREIARVLNLLALDPPQAVSTIQESARPRLRHHRKLLSDLYEHQFPSEVIALYRRLCREANWWEGDEEPAGDDAIDNAPPASRPETIARGWGGLDLLRVENDVLRRTNADFSSALIDREARIGELETALRGHEIARTELEGRISERDGRLHERHQVLARKDHAIGVLQQQLDRAEAELARLRSENAELSERVAEIERARQIAALHERELRTMLTDLQEVQLQRDAEIMGTLGSVLSRYAPGAPAAIYHRKLVDQVRRLVAAALPAAARVLVAAYGDDAFLTLGDRHASHYPLSASGVSADYTDVDDAAAIAQLEALRAEGAEYLVVTSPALPWLANHPDLEAHLEERYATVARDRGIARIYALIPQAAQIPA